MALATDTEITGAISSRISIGRFLILLMLFAVLAACKTPAWKSDPDVKAARATCEELPEGERYACIERHAVETLNPAVCRLVGIFIDDACLQTVYESAGDPAICDRLYLQGVVPNCHAYYAGRRATPSPTRTAPVPSAKAATSYGLAELLDDLHTAGATVAPTDQMVDHGFEIKGRSVNLGAGRIFVYEFPDDVAARAAASGISVGKYSLTITRQRGDVTIEVHGDWVEQPHVYTRGRLIVITGDHPGLLPLLEASLGPECIGVCRSEEPSAPPTPAPPTLGPPPTSPPYQSEGAQPVTNREEAIQRALMLESGVTVREQPLTEEWLTAHSERLSSNSTRRGRKQRTLARVQTKEGCYLFPARPTDIVDSYQC